MPRVAIVGAGPAGLALAWFLKGTKYDATVYEALDQVGKKPCAWGVMEGVEKMLPVSRASLISEIRGFRIFLDNKLVHDIRTNRTLGYIVDKPAMLYDVAQRVDVKFSSKVVRKESKYLVDEKPLEADEVVIASGHYSLSKDDTIPAIQYLTDAKADQETVDFYFYSGLLGYAWVFPDREGAKIGIGGYDSVDSLKKRLSPLVEGKKPRLLQGARVSDSGVITEKLATSIGEAAGFVYAMTGEGIRPSILSAKIKADSILSGKDFTTEVKKSKLYWTLQVHAEIVKRVKSGDAKLSGLSKALTRSDPELVLRVALGDFGKIDLLRLFGRMIL
ncbi:FAD-dependent oxidoreductase [Sulfodiicoccus acidiphilus]|uniref:FAD-dependent oxidoreductase n=1 Tax=Sulfodiicoccus acidiphilus TaxID=1670455 RepID=A0A348B2K6_9CREN|nr:NAD(P)/FAD-dependent oxidoreductase [Sulfodiicoccus acidiphilus]BBD72408.1 FAD-dependent oxidoreductase [Sulfodiicoccus acidiphilus]GGT97347.1 FAD-dependent oxidoreductase [Sulfodiicoccus acidiphilus]